LPRSLRLAEPTVDHSGTSQGVNGASDANTRITDDGARGTSASAELVVPFLDQATDSGRSWQMRFLPNGGGSRDASNFEFNPDGFVGYYLKVDPSVTADLVTAPMLEDPGTTTATAGALKTIIKDGQWHLYEWNMDDPNDFPNTFNLTGTGVYGTGGALGDTTLSGTQSFDSIAILSNTDADATIRIDQIGFNNEGTLAIPEPAGLTLLGLGALFCRRRRTA
jgi:MYXO-CTERM domain-containing protein